MGNLKMKFGNYECSMGFDENLPSKPNNRATKRHSNAKYELFIVLKGSSVIDVENDEYSLSVGDALLIAPAKFHSPLETSDDLINLILPFMMDDNTSSKDFFRQVSPCVKLHLSKLAVDIGLSIIDEARYQLAFWQESTQAKYSILMTEILRALSAAAVNEDSQDDIGPDQRLGTIDNFFITHSEKYGSEQMLAEQLHISRRQLNRILMTHYGMNFRQKLLHSRMDRAAWLLRTTDLPVSEISEAVGYISETSFYKAFKGYHKSTPQLYRKGFK